MLSYTMQVKDLVYLPKVGNFLKTQDKLFNIGVEMIWNTQDFETGISEWFDCPGIFLNHTSQLLVRP